MKPPPAPTYSFHQSLKMWQPNFHTNIMLDLECCCVNVSNPVILEIAAIYFDIDTGEKISSFHTPVNFQSCIDFGLVTDPDTMEWVKKKIPDALKIGLVTGVSLVYALFKLSNFVRTCIKTTQDRLRAEGREKLLVDSQPMIWGNGVIADNVWIRSAYQACEMKQPWDFYNNMCLRTLAQQCRAMTGKDFAGASETKFEGHKHNPLDDCLHQIKYLLKIRNHFMPNQPDSRRARQPITPEESFNSEDKEDTENTHKESSETTTPDTASIPEDGEVENLQENPWQLPSLQTPLISQNNKDAENSKGSLWQGPRSEASTDTEDSGETRTTPENLLQLPTLEALFTSKDGGDARNTKEALDTTGFKPPPHPVFSASEDRRNAMERPVMNWFRHAWSQVSAPSEVSLFTLINEAEEGFVE